MAEKDYYRLLGISRTENERGIQKAFRELAKHHHPDRVGPKGTSVFQDLLEAYETLSDPQRRRVYDARLLRTEGLAQSSPEPLLPRNRPRPEPLIPTPLSIAHDFATLHPSLDALRTRLLRNFTGRGVPKGERVADLNVEVQLSPEEARRGGIIDIGVPVFTPCMLCAGTWREWCFLCSACMGQGMV